ncbi:TonB-dependent receptor domain-containing protein, partial [Vibrio diabolicus]
DLYAADSYSSDFAKDYTYCAQNGISYADCPETQYDVTRTSNEDLDAEKSVSFNFGVSFSPIEDLDVTMDYYNISIDDVITLNTLQSMIDEERSSGNKNPNIVRDANDRIIEATAGLQNLGTLDTSGIDLKLGYRYDFNYATV